MFAKLPLLIIVFGVSLLINLCLGEVNIQPQQALGVIFAHGQVQGGVAEMLLQIRLPRLLSAALVGAALGSSGYLLQALSRNYLADPYLTGVSSGAGLAVAVALVANAPFGTLPVAALAGGLAASMLVAFMARSAHGLSVTRLLLAGVAVSAVCGSLITLAMTAFTNSAGVQSLFYWLAGSLSGRGWAELAPTSLYVGLAFLCALTLSKPLRLLSLGPQSAASLGLNVPLFQWLILIIAVILCGAAVSLSGLVGFVGLVAPYIGRAFGRDERLHLVCTACVGAVLVLLSDLAARTLAPGQELPLGTLLSLIGAPFFLWLVVRQKDEGF